jgi:hypothetical protein
VLVKTMNNFNFCQKYPCLKWLLKLKLLRSMDQDEIHHFHLWIIFTYDSRFSDKKNLGEK